MITHISIAVNIKSSNLKELTVTVIFTSVEQDKEGYKFHGSTSQVSAYNYEW